MQEERQIQRTVLVVDDDARTRQVVVSMLEGMGYRVIDAKDAQEAIDVFEAAGSQCEAVLTDLTMPGISGADLIAILRASRPGLPALLMTGYTGTIAIDAPVLRKPFGMADLQKGLIDALSGARHAHPTLSAGVI